MDKEIDLNEFNDCLVKVVLVDNPEVLVGRVMATNKSGLVLKYKGSSKATLIESNSIKSIERDSQLLDIKPSELKWPKMNTVRKHLSTHHGYTIPEVNKMTNQTAMKIHDSIHEKDVIKWLGHYHPGQ